MLETKGFFAYGSVTLHIGAMRSIELRCAIAHRTISRFRVWSFGPSRNDNLRSRHQRELRQARDHALVTTARLGGVERLVGGFQEIGSVHAGGGRRAGDADADGRDHRPGRPLRDLQADRFCHRQRPRRYGPAAAPQTPRPRTARYSRRRGAPNPKCRSRCRPAPGRRSAPIPACMRQESLRLP
jgi:hypothetical protein